MKISKNSTEKAILMLASFGVSALGRKIYKDNRKNRHKEINKKIKESEPLPTKKETTSLIEFTFQEEKDVDITLYTEMPISKNKEADLKSFISEVGGELLKSGINVYTSNGLLECNMPINELAKLKNSPELMRGFTIKNGKITNQASFSEIGLAKIGPILFFQYMAFITSQYYKQKTIERLNSIETGIKYLTRTMEAADIGTLKSEYDRLVELFNKNSYDIADKSKATEIYDKADALKNQYQRLLKNTKIDTESKWFNLDEAKDKIEALENSNYFSNLEIALEADKLCHYASILELKIAHCMKNEEDKDNIINRINNREFYDYIHQFNCIEHNVINYLELQRQDCIISRKAVCNIKETIQKEFNEKRNIMQQSVNILNPSVKLYIKVQDGEQMKLYIKNANEKEESSSISI